MIKCLKCKKSYKKNRSKFCGECFHEMVGAPDGFTKAV